MTRRRSLPRYTDIPCATQPCSERARFEYTSNTEYARLYREHEGKWKCMKHARPEEWLSAENPVRETILTVEQKSYGRFWKELHNGYARGPGFSILADDVPEGTKLVVTARLVLPGSRLERDEASADLERLRAAAKRAHEEYTRYGHETAATFDAMVALEAVLFGPVPRTPHDQNTEKKSGS